MGKTFETTKKRGGCSLLRRFLLRYERRDSAGYKARTLLTVPASSFIHSISFIDLYIEKSHGTTAKKG